ncbi:GNAT family N-acetyltransferase [Streptosporangium sp. NBC_01756]|uniref:GNAT family N-acetyltransferase n=1 Tax=Streptosporangium sp. NBC_01756 TaxID=2975950 RepID=UPI002DD9E1D7|nr:GNAT family N-acetyltransferase [Streptosporangium sp. NBC_01756]WSC86470.1 GNAT family N-acetyltransferase [Streptosporangium sp. NBC_01756]
MRPQSVIDRGEVTLRRWQQEDFEVLFQLIEESLEHLRPWMPWVAGHSRQATADFLACCGPQWDSGEAYNYAIAYRSAIVGSCSVFGSADSGGREIGYWLHPTATGCGLATLAATLLAEQAFILPSVAYVEIVHDVANAASGAVARRAGFVEVRRQDARLPLAPRESGTDMVWRLSRTPKP